MSIDLNSDLGESFGAWKMGMDEEVLPYITSANVACGWHGGDALIMEKTVTMAVKSGVAVGAHPSLPDLLGFGRRNMDVSEAEIKAYLKYQIGALAAFARSSGVRLQHVKPHGAMYNMAVSNEKLAIAVAEAIRETDPELILVGLSGSMLVLAGKAAGIRVKSEVFADRAYNEDGTLVARKLPGALITDKDAAVARVIRMVKEQTVRSITGKDIPITAETVCVHGDNPEAVAFARGLREALEAERIVISAFL
ncbi:MAG: LamB/YcsF family protein [Fusobacteriaceae bacterium]|jgi:UPF0271 protein|nr:LamB/YcsF family protein [Fusobacteriaceae bacterium]